MDIWDKDGNQKLNNTLDKTREFKRFSKNLAKEGNSKRSPHMNCEIAGAMKNERRKSSSTRA